MLLSSSWLNTCGLILLCLMFRRNSCTCVFSLNQTGYLKINRHVRNAFPSLTNWKSPRLTGGEKNHRTLIWYKVKWREQITKSHARADILAHVNIVLSRSPRLRLSCASAHSASVLSPLYHTPWFTPQEKKWKFHSEPLRVTPLVCACLSPNASSSLKLGPPVGLQTLLTAHSYASLLPSSTSTGMRK